MSQKRQFSPFVDTHCHVDLYPDPETLIGEIETAGIYTIALTNTPSVFPMTEKLVVDKKYLRSALGLHPELAKERIGELSLFEAYLPRTRYVGEIGLDYVTSDQSNRTIQQKVFERILELCDVAGDKILSVHSRRAATDVVAAIPSNFSGRIILHWYSGSIKVMKQALEKGCFFSVNFAMVSSASAKKLLHEIPLTHLLTESDGPFVKFDKTAMKPTQMNLITEGIANELSLDASDVRRSVYANFYRLLKDRN